MKTAIILTIAGALVLVASFWNNRTNTITAKIAALSPPTVEVSGSGYKTESVSSDYAPTKKKVISLILTPEETVFLNGEIGAEAVVVAQEISQKALNGKPLYLVINSPGGSVLDGAQIVSAIQASPVPVYTICQSLCASMAAIIHQSGAKRLMVDRSILMFHDAAGGVQGTFPQIKDRFEFFNSYVMKMDSEIARRAGLTLPEFLAKLNPECWRDAEDSLREHFSDGYVSLVFNGATPADSNVSQTRNLRDKFEVHLGN